MKRLFATKNQVALLLLRLTLAAVFFPHGAQKVLGWFGGHGFSGTMKHFTEGMGIPALFAFLAILAEFGGSIALALGFLTRLAALGIAVNMAVAVAKVHSQFGFFMNWSGQQKGEGFEYHILAIAIAVVLIIWGGGAASVDGLIAGKSTKK
jgi:putative oxidoreductase